VNGRFIGCVGRRLDSPPVCRGIHQAFAKAARLNHSIRRQSMITGETTRLVPNNPGPRLALGSISPPLTNSG
jgi:hypothetical protein